MSDLSLNPIPVPSPTKSADSTLRQNLTAEFEDKDYRYAYAESFLNTKLASQIRTLRQQRGMTQSQVAGLMDIKQPGYARFEDVNHSVWKTDTLWDIARALDVRVNISFESFGSLIDEKEHFDKEHLERPSFDDDPAFREAPMEDPAVDSGFTPFRHYAAGLEAYGKVFSGGLNDLLSVLSTLTNSSYKAPIENPVIDIGKYRAFKPQPKTPKRAETSRLYRPDLMEVHSSAR